MAFINLCIVFIVICGVSPVIINDRLTYTTEGSPYIVTDDIIIGKNGHLTLQPGITLQFEPGVGITVEGVLTAEGYEDRPIILSSSQPPQDDLSPPLLRLVDGPSPTRGRLQIFYKDKWRSICTNSKNWTMADREVACKQMGFAGGYFYEWQDRPNNDTKTVLYEAPHCTGLERDIRQCNWNTRSMGGGVCDMHPDMGLACDEYHALWRGTNHWRGIYFNEAQYDRNLVMDGLLFQRVSKSSLQYVTIEYAGMGPKRELTSALYSYRVPPRTQNIVVRKNLYTGINYTLPDTFMNISQSVITHNRGIGIYVNTTMGPLYLGEQTLVADNLADGVKFNLHHTEPELTDAEQFLDFCSGPNNPSVTYPMVTVARQARLSYHDKSCSRRFYSSDPDFVYTIQFMYIRVDENNSASIEIRERDRSGPILSQFAIRNGTIPASVVSRTSSIYVQFKAKPDKQVLLYMQVIAHRYKMPDISVNDSIVERNLGHGISVDNMRNMVLVHKSNLSSNIYGSGLNVRWGAGDVNVTYSTITFNKGDGVNVTYEGGKQNVSFSTVSNNAQRGFAVWFNESGEDSGISHETEVAYSKISHNIDVGVLVGNFCRNSFVNISSNDFFLGDPALQIESCWLIGEERRVLIGHNSFHRNRVAVRISPAVNLNLTVEWNQFTQNNPGTLTIFTEDLIELDELPFTGVVQENFFYYNTGRYVALFGLISRNPLQTLMVSRNTIKKNVINEAYSDISSRSESSGVVCLGSSNVQLYRNLLGNPLSLYELSSRALDQSSPINASYNWLGTKEEKELFDRVLDRRDRYNLAVIEFHPFLLSDNNMDTPVISPPQYSEPEFSHPEDEKIIGGEVNGNIVLTQEFYSVSKDIYVHHTGILTIPFGTTLEFAYGVGIMITGTLRTEGSGDKKVRFTLDGTTEKEKIKALIEAGHIDDLPSNMTSNNKTEDNEIVAENNGTITGPEIPVKLVGGKDEMEGRLMVYVNGTWGKVCNHGWVEKSAAIACQQMGYVLNPDDWDLEPADIPLEGKEKSFLLSNVQCDEFHTDILACEKDSWEEIENSCKDQSVGLRCYPRTWSGIRLGMTAQESHMKGVIIEKAGLLDYSKRLFKSALQVDFNQHVLQELQIQDNSQDGIGILYSNQYSITNPEARLFKKCTFRNNRRHGISFSQLGANISDSLMMDNRGSGFNFNPFIKREVQRELVGWLKLREEDYAYIPGVPELITLKKDEHKVFITKRVFGDEEEATFTVTTSHVNVIGIQILNSIDPSSTENLLVFDYPSVTYHKDVSRWSFRRDQTVFPTTSNSYAITIQYNSGPHAFGDVIFALTAVDRRDIAQYGDIIDFESKVPMVFIEDSKIYRNEMGISTYHYSRYLTDDEDHLLRNGNETIGVIRSVISDNYLQAILSLSPYRAYMDNDRIGEITFTLNDSRIMHNGRAIEQVSWDERESNNLFHWIFDNVTMESNIGGVFLTLPYVWQYNENFTHTVFVNRSRFMDNSDFELTVRGQFARINISLSEFERNVCSKGVFGVYGMEKEMFIRDNIIRDNVGLYMVKFSSDSQSGILGHVYAYFEDNIVQRNHNPPQRSNRNYEASSAIVVKGLQQVNITYNLLGQNEMDYELIGGLLTARVQDRLNVRANWWGSREVRYIRERIFDFDDWNNYAVAIFQPYLSESRFTAPVIRGFKNEDLYVNDDTLGGRLTEDLLLQTRQAPYTVRSDLTVMPGVTLRIEPGVTLEFHPSVGILILGKLEAVGRRDYRIVMRPINKNSTSRYRVGRQTRKEKIDVRLCVEGNCDNRNDGFLDIYNTTTQQWVPVCDDRFTERNAEVICNQLGYNRINIFYSRDIRTELYPNALSRIRSWPDPIQCAGSEDRLDECPIRMNGQIFEHSYECPWNGDFVYISCEELNLPADEADYWGGIRFSIPDFESSNLYDRLHEPHSTHIHHSHEKIVDPSILAWVDIIGAGILHGEKSPAIISFYETPRLLDVSVSQSAHDGATLISALESFEMLHNKFENNLGVGVSLIGLTGETRESDESSFSPVGQLRLPYNMFGMVDICDSSKELIIEERVVLYYKYDNRPIDCVKIFASAFDVKKFGFRFLQFNLFNSTSDPMVPDRLILYDGDLYNETSKTIMVLNSSSTNTMRFFKTVTSRMSVQLHATGASGEYGFVAEVVTLPVSTIGIDRDLLHNMTYNQFYNNREGAVSAVIAGEVNPWLSLAWSRIENNGQHLYGNITTSAAAINMDLQNMRTLYFKNNLVRNNTGGLRILAGSLGAATKLYANITNNLFCDIVHYPSLYIESKKRSSYQQAFVAYNDFSWAESQYHDVIALAQIVSDFSYNYVHSNLGRHIFDVYGFEKVRLPVYQTTSHNSFAKNKAADPTFSSTIVAGSAGQQFVDNVFWNLDNAYEMVAVNETVSGLSWRTDVWKTPIDARNNWWGFNNTAAVSGRVHDKLDDELLLKVDYHPWRMDNKSLLHGCEPGYNLVGSACYLYVGAPMTFREAKEFCERDNASLPFLQRDFHEVRVWIKRQQPEYIWDYDMIWVRHYDIIHSCAVFVNYRVRSANCDLNLPFICQSNTEGNVDPTAWVSDSLVIGAVTAVFACIVLIIACCSCWIIKSRHRRRQRLHRRNSIRASIRSNRSVLSLASTGFTDIGSRTRIIEDIPRPQAIRGSASNGIYNGMNSSFDSVVKSAYNYSVDDDSYGGYATTQVELNPDRDNRKYGDPGGTLNTQTSFDLAYHNAAFRDNSTIASVEGLGFDSRPSIWADTPGDSTPSSFRDRSLGGSTTGLALDPSNSTDIHLASTLPRDLPTLPRDQRDFHGQKFVSADILSAPDQPSNFEQGLSQSQPLETAM